MSKEKHPQVITANELLSGDVVYYDQNGAWVQSLSDAAVFDGDTPLDTAAAQVDTVVGVYLMNVKRTATGPAPIHFREDFRATGPSNYHHGKQEQSHV